MSTSKQTRRSISVRGTTYDTLRRYCVGSDRSMSDVVEELLARLFNAKPVSAPSPRPSHSVKSAPRARGATANKIVRAPAVAQPADPTTGRPAPVNAHEIIPTRVKAPKGDYRVIDF
jgi:hypothetical protein